ncbi:hypothetical protein HYH02_014331 [Chlamydomonas schloesseri]|uniref:Uncharacterized protein n=1 Tax=Chlamydomonas schloesseri TaxID=2026947 RepID=A0A835SY49_9CHLO|nr:hypothetical protein HYH02_014331 [Chlamydomonas schloesseri]|eukprot:KAG2428630.1 hypothetical protein HYH02_014331 [Chlamydomonas schloesseri]
MFSFFTSRDRWKWDVAKGVPTKDALKRLRKAVRSGSADARKRALEHVAELAEAGPELQSALCREKVTAEVMRVFLQPLRPDNNKQDTGELQEAAADALTALCHLHPDNCAAVAAAQHPGGGAGAGGGSWSPRAAMAAMAAAGAGQGRVQPLQHALALIQAYPRHVRLSTAAAGLLEAVAAAAPATITGLLLGPGGAGAAAAVIGAASAASRAALAPSTRAPAAAELLELLLALLGLMLTAAAGGGREVCREFGKAAGMTLLLQLVASHRGQAPLAAPGGSGSSSGAAAAAAETSKAIVAAGGKAAAPAAAGVGVVPGGGPDLHLSVVRDALSMLTLITSQFPAHRLPLLEADGVGVLTSCLKDLSLPWSVRLQAVTALTAAAGSPSVASELVRVRGLEVVFGFVDAYVRERHGVPGAPGGPTTTPTRGGGTSTPAPASATTGARTPGPAPATPLPGPSSPAPSAAAASLFCSLAADEYSEDEPSPVVVVEALLGLLDAVAGAGEAAAVAGGAEAATAAAGTAARGAGSAEGAAAGAAGAAAPLGGRLGVLLGAFKAGMSSFAAGGYRVATAAAQVLLRLSRQPALLPALSRPELTGPLERLAARAAAEYGGAGDAKQAAVLAGGWAAAGVLCAVRVMEAELAKARSSTTTTGAAEGARAGGSRTPGGAAGAARTSSPVEKLLSGPAGAWLEAAVALLKASTPALLAAVGAAPQQQQLGALTPGGVGAAAALTPRGGAAAAAEGISPAGLAYLSSERVVGDLRLAAAALLQVLVAVAAAEAGGGSQRLREWEVPEAARRLLAWRHVQYPAKRLLHLLGDMEAEYVPFVRYGGGALLAALLAGQGIDPAPLLGAGVDAHLLLRLEPDWLRRTAGLDEVAVLKIGRIRSAHELFTAMDRQDGRIDGCVSGGDVEAHLVAEASMRPAAAADVRERLFRELQPQKGYCWYYNAGPSGLTKL